MGHSIAICKFQGVPAGTYYAVVLCSSFSELWNMSIVVPAHASVLYLLTNTPVAQESTKAQTPSRVWICAVMRRRVLSDVVACHDIRLEKSNNVRCSARGGPTALNEVGMRSRSATFLTQRASCCPSCRFLVLLPRLNAEWHELKCCQRLLKLIYASSTPIIPARLAHSLTFVGW